MNEPISSQYYSDWEPAISLVVKAVSESAPFYVQPYPLLFPISHPSKGCHALAPPLQLSANFRAATQFLTVSLLYFLWCTVFIPSLYIFMSSQSLCPNGPPPTCSQFFPTISSKGSSHLSHIQQTFAEDFHPTCSVISDICPFNHPIFLFGFLYVVSSHWDLKFVKLETKLVFWGWVGRVEFFVASPTFI